MEKQMTRSATVPEDNDDIELIETIEPGSLEWFRLRAPLPLLLQAFFEDLQNRAEFSHYADETAKSACKNETAFWEMLDAAEEQAARLEDFNDPNAKAIVARIRRLTGCDGRLLPSA
jgi:hypothetical protein